MLGVFIVTDPVKVEIVGAVQTAVPEPWRTRADYDKERATAAKRATILFAFQLLTLVVAIGSMVATWTQATTALKQLAECIPRNSATSTTQQPPLQPPTQQKAAQPPK